MHCPACREALSGDPRFCHSCGATVPRATDPAVPAPDSIEGIRWALTRQTEGRYQPGEVIGHGSQGTLVFRALTHTGHVVALKVWPPRAVAAYGADRFIAQARAAGALVHPHIAAPLEVSPPGGIVWTMLPFVAGPDLDRHLASQGGVLSLGATQALVRQIAAALDYAHERGALHLMLRPGNVLVDAHAHAWVTDFRVRPDWGGTYQSDPEAPVGAPHFLAPEVIRCAPVGPATDQYSLAVIAWLLLTGRLPWEPGRDMFAALVDRVTAPPPSIAAQRPELAGAVDAALRRALATDPAARFPTAGAFAAAWA